MTLVLVLAIAIASPHWSFSMYFFLLPKFSIVMCSDESENSDDDTSKTWDTSDMGFCFVVFVGSIYTMPIEDFVCRLRFRRCVCGVKPLLLGGIRATRHQDGYKFATRVYYSFHHFCSVSIFYSSIAKLSLWNVDATIKLACIWMSCLSIANIWTTRCRLFRQILTHQGCNFSTPCGDKFLFCFSTVICTIRNDVSTISYNSSSRSQ